MTIHRIAGAEGVSFSPAVVSSGDGRWIHISGHIARETGKQDIAAEAADILDQFAEILGKEGGSLANVVKITAYLTSLDEYAEYNRVRGEKFQGSWPASAAVQVAGLLKGAVIEIDAVAFIPA